MHALWYTHCHNIARTPADSNIYAEGRHLWHGVHVVHGAASKPCLVPRPQATRTRGTGYGYEVNVRWYPAGWLDDDGGERATATLQRREEGRVRHEENELLGRTPALQVAIDIIVISGGYGWSRPHTHRECLRSIIRVQNPM